MRILPLLVPLWLDLKRHQTLPLKGYLFGGSKAPLPYPVPRREDSVNRDDPSPDPRDHEG